MGLKNLSLVINIWHHLTSLVTPRGDPQDNFVYPILTLMMDSYIITPLDWNTQNMLERSFTYSKTCLKRPLKRRPKKGFQDQ